MTDAEKFSYIPRYVYDASTIEEKAVMFNVGPKVLQIRFPSGKKKREIKAGAKIIDAGALNDLLNRPNEYESQDAFLKKVRGYFKICGEGFIWLNRGDLMQVSPEGELTQVDEEAQSRMPVLEMYVLPANLMILVPDPENVWGVSDYILNTGQGLWRLGKQNVIHWKETTLKFDSTTRIHLRGMSPLTPGYASLQQNIDATNASVRMYQNDGAKGILSNKTMDKLTPEQQTRVREVIDSKINNNDVKGAVAALQGEWTYQRSN